MPRDLDDAAIRERIQAISRQIDAILRKVAEHEPDLLSPSPAGPGAVPPPRPGPLSSEPPHPESPPPSANDTGKAPG